MSSTNHSRSTDTIVTDDHKTKSKTKKLIQFLLRFCGQTVSLLSLLKMSTILVKRLHLPYKNAQLCLLSFLIGYGTQKCFKFFRWNWTLILLTKLISKIFSNIIPNKYKLSPLNRMTIIGIASLYCFVYKAQFISHSHLNFAESCLGDAHKIQKYMKQFVNEMQNNPKTLNCRKCIHPSTEFCFENFKAKTIMHSKNAFKWFFKFYFCFYLVFKSKSIFKQIGNKKLFLSKVMDLLKTTTDSALRSAFSNVASYCGAYYMIPCLPRYLFGNNLTLTQHKLFSVIFIMPLVCRYSGYPELDSRQRGITLFFIYQAVQLLLNEYFDIETIANERKEKQSRKDVILYDANFSAILFAIYVSMSVIVTRWISKNKYQKGFEDKIFQLTL